MSAYDINGTVINSVYDISGNILNIAYDINGNVILSDWVDNLPDSGYSFTDGVNTYGTKLLFNFGTTSFQSVTRNTNNGYFYRASSDAYVYPYDSELNALTRITLPSTGGHKNDGCYVNWHIYWTDGLPASAYTLTIWDIKSNSLSTVNVPVQDNPNGSKRIVCGVCKAPNGKLFLVTRDEYNNSEIDHQEGDVMCVYEYDPSNNTVDLKASFPWDCVYIQGATSINGKMYVACNTQTTGSASNYTGITIKEIDLSSWSIVNTLTCSGSFEPEGCDSIQIGNDSYIWFGINKWQTVDKVVIMQV